jgi:hypothetical protein
MAKFYPDIPPDYKKSEAEYGLYRILKDLPGEWSVLHSVYVHQHAYKRSGEADFLLISPKVIMVIEVKGGEVYAEDGQWCFKNRHGEVGRKKESPYQQAESAWHALKKLACTRPGAEGLLNKIAHGWGCYLPDCEVPHDKVPPNSWPEEMMCDAAKLIHANAKDVALSMAQFAWEKDLKLAAKKERPEPVGLAPSEYEALVDCFRPNFNSVPSMSSAIQAADGELIRLTAEQGDALWGMEGVSRLLVHGPAGTGKTLIAETRFHSLLENSEQSRVALVCFNVHLADHLSSLNMLRMKPGRSFVGTVHSLLREFSPALKANPGDHEGCLRDLKAWRSSHPEGAYDTLIVDEGQDLRAQPKLCEALGLLVKGGWAAGEWVWFEDRGQALVKYGESVFEPRPEVSYRLKRNVRNSLHIAEFANKSTSNPATPSDIPGHQVKPLLYKSSDLLGRLAELEAVVDGLLKKGFRPEDIVLLDYAGAGDALSEVRRFAGVSLSSWTSGHRRGVLRHTSVRKFKGMEAAAVVVYNVTGKVLKDDPLFYVASTRPKVSLTILADQDAMNSIVELMVG